MENPTVKTAARNPASEQMDAEAAKAAQELQAVQTAQDVANWMRKWYVKAGYKRLSRLILTTWPKE